MTLYKNDNVENPIALPTGSHFQDYYLQDEKRLQTLFDVLFDPHQPLSETIQKHLTTIKSYLSGEQSFEEFCKEVRKYNNNVLCGLVWTNATISYRCRTCATNPCMSLCPDCFHGGNHDGHDANMFRSIGGGICDCGDSTVMNSNGFCKHHGSNRIPNKQIPYKLIRCAQILLPRLILICYIFSLVPSSDNIECCICQSKDDQNPLGLIVRLVDTGVLGVREVHHSLDNYLPLAIDSFNNDEFLSKDRLTCCHLHSKLNNKQQSSIDDEIKEVESNYLKCEHKNELTCAQFYEEKIRSMLEIFSEENVSKSITISWRTGLIVNSCGHSIHLSCYKQYLKSHIKKIDPEIDPYIEFKCPMCRQTSNALISIPQIDKQIESNDSIIETITHLIENNTKPCISPTIAEWLVNFIQKMYLMVNKHQRTIDKQEKEPNDNIIALFLISILRFNLENDLLIRDIEHINTKMINRKSCFYELFYICNLKYPYLLNNSNILLWYRITGLMGENLKFVDKQFVPLLLSDPIALLLQIMLSLPFSITKEFYRVIVQALFNLTYIQALFTIVTEMNKTEQEIWSNQSENIGFNSKNMTKYLRIISFKLSQANFNLNTDNSKVWSLESINASIQERCGNFIKIASLIQHHLYQPITWWFPGHSVQFDFLWRNLFKELELYDIGEPYWFCNDSLSLILNWLDEVFLIDQQQSMIVRKIAHAIPSFDPPRFIELPTCYSDLFRSCTRLHCPYCQNLIIEPILCLICGIVYPQERSEQKCCDKQTHFIKEHLMTCSGALNISININSTKTLIQRERRYTYWSSLYLDQHGEEDLNLRRGRILYLNENRLKLLYSSWITSNLDQLITRWSIDQFDF